MPCSVFAATVNRMCCSVLPDNVTLQIDGVLYLRVMDPYKVLPNLQPLSCASHGLCVMCCSAGSLLPSAHTLPSAWLDVPHEAGGLSTQIPPVAPDSASLWQECLWQVSCFPMLPCSGGSFSALPFDSVVCSCSPGQLWGGRSRVRSNPAGPDHHEI